MKKLLCLSVILALAAGGWIAVGLVGDHAFLQDQLVRLHVVGASNSPHDQSVKLQVRDAVLEKLETVLDGVTDAQAARACIAENLSAIQTAANDALELLQEGKTATVTFLQEEFPLRAYDSFTLPAGIYQSLRVSIGTGEGRNWWCVVFPRMCYDAISVQTVAAGAGFSQRLSNTITGQQGYQIRFFLLDMLGRAENFFH